MTTLLAISPHLDDAVFSVGATLWRAARRGWRVVVATVFTGNVAQPTGFALVCQLDKGLTDDVDYMALRRAEDEEACARLGADALHLPLLEAPHRGYESAPTLFGDVSPYDPAKGYVRDAIAALLADLRPDILLAPLGIGGHVDHLVVRDAVAELNNPPTTLLWEDWPYLDRSDLPARDQALGIPAGPDARAAKLCACAAYASQLGFQFGGKAALRNRLASQQTEWLHPA
ncbi:PIG-L deacetylase family protein [Sphingomonas sp. LHG3443-2]|uniref:PIG-L deacetylase family protein n=1 Tax=Sphingomonas sp. LHG3443-2 TaxID=2804639 RepID=UPI003CF01667